MTQWLLKFATVHTYDRLSEWASEAIQAAVETQAERLEVNLGNGGAAYLAEAIGNDTARLDSELQKIKGYAGSRAVTPEALVGLVPNPDPECPGLIQCGSDWQCRAGHCSAPCRSR